MNGLNLHVYPSPILNESRILRETRSAFGTGLFRAVEVAGTWAPDLQRSQPWVEGVTIRRFGRQTDRPGLAAKLWKTGSFASGVLSHYRKSDITVINCHSLAALPMCRMLAALTSARLIYDTHELETETLVMTGAKRRAAKALERALIGSVDHTFVVGRKIEEWYRETYDGIVIDTLYNLPARADDTLRLEPDYFHQRFDLPTGTTVVLYQGVLAPGRGIEPILQACSDFADDSWVFVAMGYGEWTDRIAEIASLRNNVFLHRAVPPEEVLAYSRAADIGLSMIDGRSCLSYELSAPNKLHQYLYVGLPVVVSDLPEQRLLVEACDGGMILDECTGRSVAEAIQRLQGGKPGLTAPVQRAAWESYDDLISSVYERLTARV